MKKIFFIALILSQLHGDPCIDQNTFNLANVINSTANIILGKVSSLQGNQTNNTIISSADEIISEIDICCESLSNQLDTIEDDIEDVALLVESCCENISGLIESCCENISGLIESCCESLAEQLECMATVVPPTQAAITDPGAYILCEDRGPLTISASGATLDMDGHNITTAGGDGLTITGDNVLVKNGRVIGAIDGVFGGVVIGAAASAAQIRNVEVAATVGSTGNGVIIDSNGGVIEKVKTSGFTGASGNAFIISGPNNVLRYCVDEGGEIGFLVTIAGLNTLIENCLSENNPAAGFQLGLAGSALTNVNVIVRGCLARGAGAAGFRVLDGPDGFLIEDCIATANVDGFQVSTAQDIDGVIRGCVAVKNTSDGFQNSLAGPNIQFISNRSLRNTAFGFTTVNIDQRLYNNSAFANGTNFNAAAIANNTIAVDPPGSDIGWWANV